MEFGRLVIFRPLTLMQCCMIPLPRCSFATATVPDRLSLRSSIRIPRHHHQMPNSCKWSSRSPIQNLLMCRASGQVRPLYSPSISLFTNVLLAGAKHKLSYNLLLDITHKDFTSSFGPLTRGCCCDEVVWVYFLLLLRTQHDVASPVPEIWLTASKLVPSLLTP